MTPNSPPYNYDQAVHQINDDSFDIKRYLSLFISNWYWFAISLLISLSISYGINRWSEKLYRVSSTLLIRDDANVALTNIFPGSNAYKTQQNLNNEIGILKSYRINEQVIQELPDFNVTYIKVGRRGIAETRLYRTSPFTVLYESLEKQPAGKNVEIKILSQQKYILKINGRSNFEKEMMFGESFNEMGFNFIIELKNREGFRFDPRNSNKYYFYFEKGQNLANYYRSKLSIVPSMEESSLLTLTTTGFVPEQEADFLNKLMKVYLRFGLEYKNKTVEQTLNFIDEQLGKVSDSLKITEGELEFFKLSNHILDISNEGKILQDKLNEIDAEKTNLYLKKQYLDYLIEYMESKNENEEIIAPALLGVDDQQLVGLVNSLSEKQIAKRQFGMNLDTTTETYKLVTSEIELLRKAINENLKESYRLIDRTFADIENRINSLRAEMMKLPATERQLINIQRKYDINNTVYTYLLEKKAEAGIARASNVPDNREIDLAGPSTTSRIKPKEKQNNLLAVVLGLAFPFILIIIIDVLNNKIIDRKDVERYTQVPILGYISHNSLHSELPVMEKTGSTLAESFRSVRTNLKYFIRDTKKPVISICSTINAEGKTFISANLAAIIALSGKKVLLIGLDLRKPRIHKLFNIRNELGISNYLIGQEKYEDIIGETEVENLWYAASGPVPPNPAELIDSPSMVEFIERAKSEFDFIIIDTPPVALVTDALLCSSYTDLYLFVVRQRYSSKSTLELIEELHKDGNLKSMGIIINDISLSGYYGYGLRYGYYLGYGYSYGYNYYGSYAERMYGYKGSSGNYYAED